MAATLPHHQIRAIYDRIGARQDWQCFYEGPATADLVAHLELAEAHAVLEFGCGTGALAATLLAQRLGAECRYLALDSSRTMARLAAARLEPWRDRAEVRLTDGSLSLGCADASVDRFLSAYLLDLLSEDRIRARGIFNPEFVNSVMNAKPHPHLRWHYFMLWQMIGVELWCEAFLSSPPSGRRTNQTEETNTPQLTVESV